MQSHCGNFLQGLLYGTGPFYPCTRLNLANMLTGLPNNLRCQSKGYIKDEEIERAALSAFLEEAGYQQRIQEPKSECFGAKASKIGRTQARRW